MTEEEKIKKREYEKIDHNMSEEKEIKKESMQEIDITQ